jgi:hypothetical protein
MFFLLQHSCLVQQLLQVPDVLRLLCAVCRQLAQLLLQALHLIKQHLHQQEEDASRLLRVLCSVGLLSVLLLLLQALHLIKQHLHQPTADTYFQVPRRFSCLFYAATVA